MFRFCLFHIHTYQQFSVRCIVCRLCLCPRAFAANDLIHILLCCCAVVVVVVVVVVIHISLDYRSHVILDSSLK